ncbi:LOW QUALITY PROTEIN: uncharacterized protein K02A2.6-like [Myripristis murdjan]|uniref:LOW QUALITY PROTEIN: uncharacterized protein K02A2.6-like n=1 Tax=Myripristis murdjan TaxID=586833 RepID=UPI0011761F98|nr:LOW QUALITY PROTEIN: uncharacterized protein K02A2.6-like [Myripristis murdjan]
MTGHIARACRNNKKSNAEKNADRRTRGRGRRFTQERNVHYCSPRVAEGSEEEEQAFPLYSVLGEEEEGEPPYKVCMALNEEPVTFEVDTGCGLTILNKKTFKKSEKCPSIEKKTRLKLRTYTKQKIKVLGKTYVKVNYKQQEKILPIIVVRGTGPNLLGRWWLKHVKLDWAEIKNQAHHPSSLNLDQVHTTTNSQPLTLEQVLQKHEGVFKEELGTLKGFKATIHVPDNAAPRFYRPRSVPYAMKPKVDAEIDRLLKENIITPVKYSEWAAPVVPLLKPDGACRLCGDYKLTVNRVSTLEQYPIPKVEDLMAVLAGGQQFTKLDMSHAYQQIQMDDQSKKYLTVNTHRGMFTYNRLPFGVSSAPAIFQRTMEGVLQGIPQVAVYLDDILVTGETREMHLKTLDEVLTRLEDAGLRLKRSKCTLLADEVQYLGHKVDAKGVHTVEVKVKAVVDAPTPTSMTELKAYLGLLNYYNRFLPNLSTLLAPLHHLLRKDVVWSWGDRQEEAFRRSKDLLKSADVLVHYSGGRPLILACDASPYGVGAVLSHRMEDGTEKPIGFVSRTLAPAEKKYSQLDKEGLAVIFGIKRFHKYLYGRNFTIVTDHKPLISLFNETKPVPQMVSPRVQRWSVWLRAYEYHIVYRPGKQHVNADALSRLPLPETFPAEEEEDLVLMLDGMDDAPVTTEQVRHWTAKDVTLSRVHGYVLKGWPLTVEPECMPYFSRRLELSVRDGCVLWGARVIIPQKGRKILLKLLHQSHPGMSRMKGLARSYVWWPQMDQDVEREVHQCDACQQNSMSPSTAPLHPWEWPEKPWTRVHVDYAGPFLGKMFLVLVDSHSKWMDVYPVNTATTHGTIEKLRQSFSVHGLPQMLVSDNATCFMSAEFADFMSKNGIKHVTSAPFHPSSNGLAERAVRTFKEGMKRMQGVNESLEAKVSRFLFSYRITPHSTTGLSPAEMLMSRRPRSAFDLLLPDLKSKVEKKQWKQKVNHDNRTKLRSFSPGNPVFTRNYGYGPKWIPGTVESCTGPLSCTVLIGNGQVVRRHVDQIRKRELSGVPDTDPSTPQVVNTPSLVIPEEVQSPEVRASDSPTPVEDFKSDTPMLGSEPPPEGPTEIEDLFFQGVLVERGGPDRTDRLEAVAQLSLHTVGPSVHQ